MIQTKTISYGTSSNTFEGVIAWDDRQKGAKPLVLVVHSYVGQAEFDVNKAKALAEKGYLAFAIDMYGKGRRASTPDEAQALMAELNQNRQELLSRIQLAVQTGKELAEVDEAKIAAIGFCFGGKCVLDLARSGADIQGVVSFHGVYDPPGIAHSGPIRASVLVLHGWEDPLANPQQTVELASELTARKADWNIHAYGHTGHAFTNPHASAPERGMFYSEKSNSRSWKSMENFLAEIFR